MIEDFHTNKSKKYYLSAVFEIISRAVLFANKTHSYYEELTLDNILHTYFEKKENYGESCCALQVKINPSKVDTFFFSRCLHPNVTERC